MKTPRSKRNAAVPFIFATILLDALGIGLLIPVLPDVIRRFGSNPSFVTHYYGYFISVYALMQFVASPVLGSLSDRYGRRSVLLVSLIGSAIDYVLMAFAPTMGLLFIGRVISGLTGASMTVATSYIADVSNDSNRSSNFGLIGAAFGLGFIVGPGAGGLLGHYGPQAPFLAAAGLNLLNFLFGLFVLPESLPAGLRRKISLRRLNPIGSLAKILRPSPILALVWVYLLIYLAGQAHPSVWTLYTEYKFGWSSFQVGLSLSFVGLSIAVAQGGLTRIVIPRWGEERSLAMGLGIYIVCFALFAFATHGWMMYVILSFFALSGVAGPALQSLISKDVPSQEQGELQGTLVSIGSLTSIIGPLLYTWLFASFTKPGARVSFPGIPYLVASFICVLSLAMLMFSRRRKTLREVPLQFE
jgi:DHA1 family tetracycline resistance protein-like MFS transporter